LLDRGSGDHLEDRRLGEPIARKIRKLLGLGSVDRAFFPDGEKNPAAAPRALAINQSPAFSPFSYNVDQVAERLFPLKVQ
jgi:hypothetical protein